MVTLAVLGVIVVSSGRAVDGMRMLDEATAAVLAGDVKDPLASANVCCALVTASVRVRDLERLAQWSRHAMDITRAWADRALFSYPRIEHAVALLWWGRWQEAESELLGVMEDMQGRPLLARLAMLRLAELRRRQGRSAEARELLRRLDDSSAGIGLGHLSDAVRAALALDAGDPATAVEVAEHYLRAVPVDDVAERVDGLEVLARAAALLGDIDQASAAAAELGEIAERVCTAAIRAAARSAAGTVAAARGDAESARAAHEEAIDLYDRAGAPFKTARTRLDLARSLLALGVPDVAAEQTRKALDTFQALGAAHDVQEASGLLATLQTSPDRGRDHTALTGREQEILRLLARGLSNTEIADHLVLSIRTVERHISNIYTKIGAHGRTARAVAAAYAYTHALT